MSDTPIRIQSADFWPMADPWADNPLLRILQPHFNLVRDVENPQFVLYSVFGEEFRRYSCTRILYTGENVRPNWKECDYAFSFDHPTDARNYRLPLYRFYNEYEALYQARDVEPLLAGKSRFCNFIYSNARAKERLRFLDALNKYRAVDCGGRLRNNVGGPLADKVAFQRACKFTIAFENSSHPGYTTEKIVHAFAAGTVPIYWGNPRIAEEFNPEAFVNCHEFENFDQVVRRVAEIDQDDARYRRMLVAPAFRDNREPDALKEEAIVARFKAILEGGRRFITPSRLDRTRWRFFRMRRKWDGFWRSR
jgi:hypothetical protein